MKFSTSYLLYFPRLTKWMCYCLFQFAISYNLYAQIPDQINQFDENSIKAQSEQTEYTILLSDLAENPIDVELLDERWMSIFDWFTEEEKTMVLSFIAKNKPLLSKYELQVITSVPLDKIRKLMPYITINTNALYKRSWKELFQQDASRLVLRIGKSLDKESAFNLADSLPGAYVGDELKAFMQFKYALPGKLSYGFHLEKDPGEKWWGYRNTGVDFLSAHLFIDKLYKSKIKLAIGDYAIRIGQGLLLDNLFSSGRTTSFGSWIKTPLDLKPYSSLQEGNMLRGLALKARIKRRIQLLTYGSRLLADASVVSTDLTTIEDEASISEFTSISQSGLHRTKKEISTRQNITLQYLGASLQYKLPKGHIGANLLNQFTNSSFTREDRIDLAFVDQDKLSHFGSCDYIFSWRNISSFGELAIDDKLHPASLIGIVIALGKNAELISAYRNFHPGFYSLMSNTLSISGTSRNEKGIMGGLSVRLNPRLQLSVLTDTWSFPWLKYQTESLTSGNEIQIKAHYQVRKKWLTYFQYSQRENTVQTNTNEFESPIGFEKLRSFRQHFEFILNRNWTLRQRLEFKKSETTGELARGYLAYFDLLYRNIEAPVSFNFRTGIYDSPSYNTRIYAFENDLLYQFSIPAYYGKGIVFYLNVRAKLLSKITIEGRYSLKFSTINTFSTHLASPEKYQQDIKIQFRYQF